MIIVLFVVQVLQEEILDLSARYVKALAAESQNTIDGPYAGRLTGYGQSQYIIIHT